MRYITKVRIVRITLPIVVIGCCATLGYDATRSLFAQTPAPAGITLTTSQRSYTISQTVAVTLHNASPKSVFILNKCPGEPFVVYRQVRGAWVPVHDRADSAKCAGEPRDYEIPAGGSAPVDYSYWPRLFDQPGTYRIVAPIESYDSGPTVSFAVTP